ncbi:hypothetical protein [Paenibacillus terrae]|uniref:Uncharacterized protein n=1 Tax=Paenibacillus terrae TaxID=159743 RepID=A0A0D7WTX6_9BACL|nr:hypothetical protein [Paenibacillus terrae]KJD42631.1 hypothetical protein QD47_27150 [Paenibacillus terrae]
MADNFYCSIEIVKGFYPNHIWEFLNTLGDFKESENTYFYSKDAPNGQLDELEEFLIRQGIPFDRNSKGFCEIEPELRVYRPGLIDQVIIKNNDGYSYVPTDSLREVLSMKTSLSEIVDRISTLVEEVEPSYPELISYRIMWGKSDSKELFEPNATIEDRNIHVVAVLNDVL